MPLTKKNNSIGAIRNTVSLSQVLPKELLFKPGEAVSMRGSAIKGIILWGPCWIHSGESRKATFSSVSEDCAISGYYYEVCFTRGKARVSSWIMADSITPTLPTLLVRKSLE